VVFVGESVDLKDGPAVDVCGVTTLAACATGTVHVADVDVDKIAVFSRVDVELNGSTAANVSLVEAVNVIGPCRVRSSGEQDGDADNESEHCQGDGCDSSVACVHVCSSRRS
jgi:hypothetical protein